MDEPDDEDQLENVANKLLLTRQMEMASAEIPPPEDKQHSFKRQGPIQLEELPAPLQKLYAKSVQDLPMSSNQSNPNDQRASDNKRVTLNEPLLGGFALLRAAQLLNIDIYYVGLKSNTCGRSNCKTGCWYPGDDHEAVVGEQVSVARSCSSADRTRAAVLAAAGGTPADSDCEHCYRTILDDLASYNPLQDYIDRHKFLAVVCRLAKIFLSLTAIVIGFNEFLSTILLCLSTIGTNLNAGAGSDASTANSNGNSSSSNNNSSMGLFVLVLVQFSSIYILFSTIFNGHLLWNLFSQRQFLVSKRFQCKTMLKLLVFIYLEYVINIAFVSNLYDWNFTSNNIESGSYSVLANLRILVTFKDFDHYYIDILMTIIAFARGIIRTSPYITINYAIICLKEHINTIRNQRLLTDSLKKRQKLRLVVGKTSNRHRNDAKGFMMNGVAEPRADLQQPAAKKRVNFVTEPIVGNSRSQQVPARRQTLATMRPPVSQPKAEIAMDALARMDDDQSTTLQHNKQQLHHQFQFAMATAAAAHHQENRKAGQQQPNGFASQQQPAAIRQRQLQYREAKRNSKDLFLERIENFDELEAYITNLYIFTGKLNRFMSSQGLTVFFIVHNLVISGSLIIPEAINGGPVMVQIIRLLLMLIAILPFIVGQSLSDQLEQLSKQIDRIIIQQHFIHRRRDNLVRIRELIHDIKVNCGGMLNFNVATGLKYLVVAFAGAFFVEQEHYKLTRRHKAEENSTIGWVVGMPVAPSGDAMN